MNYYIVSALVNFVLSFFLGITVFAKNPRSKVNVTFSLFAFAVAFWSLSYFFWQIAILESNALFWSKILMAFAIFIPAFYLHFVLSLTGNYKKAILIVTYAIFFMFLLVDLFTTQFVTGIKSVLFFKFWPIPGVAFHLFLLVWALFVIYSTYLLYSLHRKSTGLVKIQSKYLLLGMVIGFAGGSTNYLLWYGIPIPPFGNILVSVYVAMTAYAIIKHRFLDIRLIVARAIAYLLLIFILATIYSVGLFVAGTLLVELTFSIPSLVISTVLALIIAFSFQPLRGFLEHITDRIFYRGHYNSNVLLSQLSTIMSFNIELYNLCHEVLDALIKQMKISRGAFVILGEGLVSIYDVVEIGFYNEAHKGNLTYGQISAFLPFGNILVFDELAENHLKNLMRELDVSIVKTLTVKNQVMGVLLLGEKASGEIYSEQDLKMLEILAPEVSVAIQNSLSYDKIKKFNVILSEEVKRATADLQNANQRLRNLDQLKDEFVSVASHELRTPMTAIRSYAWMVLNKADVPLSEKVKKYLVRVLMSTERLIHLVNDMLNISRIESGRIEITPEPVDLLALTRDVVDEVYYSKSQEKTLHFEVLEKPVPKAFADPEKLRQVLLNLVGNSLKFTPAGGKISFDFFSDGQTVEITVKDSGVGIAKEDLGRLFQKFGRLDSSYVAAASSGGTGLGLYIAKSLIDLMHGRIWARSEGRGQGASFTISLPTATEDKIKNALYYTIKARGGAKGLEPAAL